MANIARPSSEVRTPFPLNATILAVLLVGVLYWARVILIPLALAVFLAFLLGPSVSRLRKFGLSRAVSALVIVGLAIIVVMAVGWLVTSQLSALVHDLPNHMDDIRGKLASVANLAPGGSTGFGKLLNDLDNVLKSPTTPTNPDTVPIVVQDSHMGWLSAVWMVAGPAVEAFGQIALTFLLAVFLLINREDMRNRVLRLMGSRRMTTMTKAMDDAGSRISRFLLTQLMINSAFGLLLTVGLLIFGVPFAFLWGFFAGLMRYVPYVGPVIGFTPAILTTLVLSKDWHQPLEVLALFAALEIFVNAVIEPRFLGHSLGVSEVAQIFSAAFWAFLWGPIGLVLSGPLTACILVLGKNVPRLRYLEVLLGVEEVLPAEARLYQRFAARDRDEALQVATDFAATHEPDQVRDDLLVPALGRVQQALDETDLSDSDVEFAVDAAREIADQFDLLPVDLMGPLETTGERMTILSVAAGGPADGLIVELLAAKLNPAEWNVVPITNGALASDILSSLREHHPAMVLIGVAAPTPTNHARYLCKRLRTREPNLRLLVGRWAKEAGAENGDLAKYGANEVFATIPEALRYLQSVRTSHTVERPDARTNEDVHGRELQPVKV